MAVTAKMIQNGNAAVMCNVSYAWSLGNTKAQDALKRLEGRLNQDKRGKTW